jgi:hypothetical protein
MSQKIERELRLVGPRSVRPLQQRHSAYSNENVVNTVNNHAHPPRPNSIIDIDASPENVC